MLIREVRRYYNYEPRRTSHYPERRRSRSLTRPFNPLQLLVLLAIGAGIAHFIPSLLCVLIQFGTVLAVGLVGWWCYTLLFRR